MNPFFSKGKKTESCPFHKIPLELSYQGVKEYKDWNVRVEGLPILYCPACLSNGKDYSRELQTEESEAFLKNLFKLLEKSRLGQNEKSHLNSPSITLNFNPIKYSLERDSTLKARRNKGGETGGKELDPDILSRVDNFSPIEPRYGFERLILPDETKEELISALALLEKQTLIYETWNLRSIDRAGRKVALNFFGPPGTGKTLAAEAIAEKLGKKLLTISYAELESKYVGETPKNIKAAFEKAALSNSVLFFDEADSILGKRLTSITQSADHGVNLTRSTTLIELDEYDGIVIFASNLIQNYDSAFLRRMLAHIEFKLPTAEMRSTIWKTHLPPQLPIDGTLNFDALAYHSENASGADIKTAILMAASQASMRALGMQRVNQEDFEKAIRLILEKKSLIATKMLE
ncbi:MAG: ATP-binding protein [Chloroherpetonaceae bacterium]|nr:ATP-binding protein [Chloroherpetonaceae bacterium]